MTHCLFFSALTSGTHTAYFSLFLFLSGRERVHLIFNKTSLYIGVCLVPSRVPKNLEVGCL